MTGQDIQALKCQQQRNMLYIMALHARNMMLNCKQIIS